MITPDPPRKVILHVDGDSFFASCEVARNPQLAGKPVVTGEERGIVSAATYAAKKLGITRAMPLYKVRRDFPQVVVLSSDYEYYSLMGHRMYDIVRRYTPLVEEYGIDECFGDLTGLETLHGMTAAATALRIKEELHRELNMTFSLGVGPTKVLAKIGSNWKKPDNFTYIDSANSRTYLEATPVRRVWGIGYRTAAKLEGLGILTAQEFADKDEDWVRANFTKPLIELWHELNSRSIFELDVVGDDQQQSIQCTRTRTPPTTDPTILFSELSKNIEHACRQARGLGLKARSISFFLKTQSFRYQGANLALASATSTPQDLLKRIQPSFLSTFRPRTLYRATGVTLHGLTPDSSVQLDIFDGKRKKDLERLFMSIDTLDAKFGRHTLYLGSSAKALARERRETPGNNQLRIGSYFGGDALHKRLPIPYMGEVS